MSLKHLAYFPYNISIESWYPVAKGSYTYNNTISLFHEKVDVDRTCESVGVAKENCLCSWFEPIDDDKSEDLVKNEMMKLFSEYLVESENIRGKCTILEGIASKKMSKFSLKTKQFGFDALYKIEMVTKGGAEIKAVFNFALKKELRKQMRFCLRNCILIHILRSQKMKCFFN